MSTYQVFRTGKLTDRQIYSLVNELDQKWTRRKALVQLAGGQATSFDAAILEGLIGKKNREVMTQSDFYSAENRFEVRIRRGIGRDQGNPDSSREASPYYDEIWLKLADPGQAPPLTPDETVELVDSIRKYVSFEKVPSGEGPAGSATELLQAQFNQLNALFTDMLADVEARRVQLESEFDKRKLTLDEQHQSLLAEAARREDDTRSRIEQQTTALEQRTKELDDRDHMHARRQLRERITSDIQGRLSRSLVPSAAGVMRWTVLALALLGAAVFGYSAIVNIGEFSSLVANIVSFQNYKTISDWTNNVPLWILLIKGAFSSGLALAFLVYSISWLRQLYHQDVKAHREFERYSYDIDRASWAIETIMEATSKEGVHLPDSWVAGVTRNLFEAPMQREHEASNEALAAILNATAKAEIGPGGATFELNGRGAKKLAKDLVEKA